MSVLQISTQLLEGDSGLTEVNVGLVVTLNTNTLDRDIPILANTVDVAASESFNIYRYKGYSVKVGSYHVRGRVAMQSKSRLTQELAIFL